MCEFEWDYEKAIKNKQKHKVSFELAKLVFDDPFQFNGYSRTTRDEDRYQVIGQADDVILFVVYTYRETSYGKESIRIISARKAGAKERAKYNWR